MRVRTYKSPYAARVADEILPTWLSYPSGWFCLGFSRQWKPGDVHTRPFMGTDVPVHRTREGKLRADPLPIREAHGIVWVGHTRDRTPPGWEIPSLPESFVSPHTYCAVEMAGHPQDVMENFIDHRHIIELHGVDFLDVLTEAKADGPFFSVTYRVGRSLPFCSTVQDIRVQFIGLGAALMTIELPRYHLTAAQWLLVTPVGPGRIRYWGAASATVAPSFRLPSLPRHGIERLVGFGMNRWSLRDSRADWPIYHHKAYLPHPRLNSEDGPIGAFRHWARQFSSDGSDR
ncbi:hypothetical protein ABZ752_16665 [Streptomyces roseifaciens]